MDTCQVFFIMHISIMILIAIARPCVFNLCAALCPLWFDTYLQLFVSEVCAIVYVAYEQQAFARLFMWHMNKKHLQDCLTK